MASIRRRRPGRACRRPPTGHRAPVEQAPREGIEPHADGEGDKAFAWERSFSKADIKRFGEETPPGGPIVAVRVEDLHEKEAVLAANPKGVFTIPHFDGYAAVLVELEKVRKRALRELLLDGWLACAPAHLADSHLKREQRGRDLGRWARQTGTYGPGPTAGQDQQ